MKYLIDTNIFLDIALFNEKHFELSSMALGWFEKNPGCGFIAWHSVSNIFYILKKNKPAAEVRKYIEDISVFVKVAPVSSDSLQMAMDEPINDFEDAMQVAAARACSAHFVITNNLKDFKGSSIKAISPAQFLARL